jgi:hypothetical protein
MPTNAVAASAIRHDAPHRATRGGGGGGGGREHSKRESAAAALAPSASTVDPPSYPVVSHKSTMPKFMYSREFLLKVARQSKLIEKPPPNIMPELLRYGAHDTSMIGCAVVCIDSLASFLPCASHRPLNEAGPARAPPAPAGAVPRAATKFGVPMKPSVREVESLRDRERGDRGDRGERPGTERAGDRRWNEPRERERDRDDRGAGRDRDRGDRAPRDGTYDSKGRFESTPSWANAEVKHALDDEDTFGGGDSAAGEFILGGTLDRDADAKVMAEMGWGQMFRASADLEQKAAQEREEIRRQMAREAAEQDQAGSSDFTELPEDHPLMLQKSAAAAAAAAASSSYGRNPTEVAASLAHQSVSSDEDLAKLDELLAAKAARAAADKRGPAGGLGSVHEPEDTWGASSVKPRDQPQASPEAEAGTSKFASRFGFGLQGE